MELLAVDRHAVVRNEDNIDWQARLFGAMQHVRAPFTVDFVISGRRTRSQRATLPQRRS